MLIRVARHFGPLLEEAAFSELYGHRDFQDTVTGHFPEDPVSGDRIIELLERIDAIQDI